MSNDRLEHDRLDWIVFAADFLTSHLTPKGRIVIPDTEYPESHLYLAADLFPILEAYKLSGKRKYLAAASRILEYLRLNQTPSGTWTLGYAVDAGGERTHTVCGYGSYRELADKTSALIPGFPLAAIRKYERMTGDEAYRPTAARAIEYLAGTWNDEWGFDDGFFRSTFKDFLCACGLSLWQDVYPETEALVVRAVAAMTENPRWWNEEEKNWLSEVGSDQVAFPSATLMNCCALLETTGKRFIESHIRPAFERLLANTAIVSPGNRSVLTSWPFNQERASVRGNSLVLLLMKLLDIISGRTSYRQTTRHRELVEWIETMQDDQGFFEYQECQSGRRVGHASPAQFLISFWVCGTFKWD
jgi:hypothetical protein